MQYYGADGLGSVRQMYNSSGQVIASTRYDPYGSVVSQTGTATSVFAFTGEQYDSYIKLLYLRARWYDYGTGRFTQPDPIIQDFARPQSINRYPYGWNNPVLYTDPTGHDIFIVEGWTDDRDYVDPKSWKTWISAYTGSEKYEEWY